MQVVAPPGCESAARAFYGDALGLAEMAKPTPLAARGGCWFRAGEAELHVGVTDVFVPATKAHPALLVASTAKLHGLAASLGVAGIEVRWADDAEIPGQQRFFVDDPWGNRVELIAPTG